MTRSSTMTWAIAFLISSSLSIARADDPQPQLQVDRPVFHFGSVDQGQRVEHVFKIRNVGRAPLRIQRIAPACDCTIGAATDRDVAPGREAWVTVSLETDELAGEIVKKIGLFTNDPAHSGIGLSVQGRVLVDVLPEPPVVYLGAAEPASSTGHVVRIRPGRADAAARVTGVRVPSFLRAELRDDAAGQLVELGLAPGAPAGRVHGDLVLSTSSPRQPEVVVPVFGTVRASTTAP